MAMAVVKPAISCYLWLLFVMIMVSIVNKPALAEAGTPPSTLVFYIHQNGTVPDSSTVLIVASPSAASGGPPVGFGSIAVFNNELREGAALDSPVLGKNFGDGTFGIDLTIFSTSTYALDTPSYSGTISTLGVTDASGFGELGITTGTGDFSFAKGYVEFSPVFTDSATGIRVFKNVFHIKYDCQ